MRVLEYNQFDLALTLTLTTERADDVPSTVLIAAHRHEEWAAAARAALREWKHNGENAADVPAALSLSTYFPTHNGSPLYALNSLAPAGTQRDVDSDYGLEVMRLRYVARLVLLPAALQVEERIGFAIERHCEKALRDLFAALRLPTTYIPGDESTRGGGTVIDFMCELGAAQGAPGLFEVTVPTAP